MCTLALLLTFGLASSLAAPGAPTMSLYELSTRSLDGQAAPLSAWQGKVALVVNVASKCGYTPQYAGLQALYTRFADRGLVVLGFPSNEFGGQEPGAPEEIKSFCQLNYGVTFPLFEKGQTKPGAGQNPVYTFLTQDHPAPAWNFAKYLVGRDGKVLNFYPSKVAPDAPELVGAIEAALGK